MAIFKPSNFKENLGELDAEQNNLFQCQVNTSGSSVKGYKMTIYDAEGANLLYDGNATDLGSPIKNKGTLSIQMGPDQFGDSIENGKNYQWTFRTYDAQIGSTVQPDTVVCTGYLVGSTRYVIWTRDNDKIENDMYLEFDTMGPNQMMPILEPNVDNIVLPSAGEKYRERHKITWVTSSLGWDENITKIELDDAFKYNYIDGTSFKLYRCSDQHTATSVYVDPNDGLERGNYINIANTGRRKIIGYSEETGEVRVQEAFSNIPTNGQSVAITDAEGVSLGTTVVGGTAISDATFTVMTNRWDNSAHRLFIQPNINIKPDLTNPNEIVFDQSGVRVDISMTTSTTVVPGKTTDITFDKLDNTQWLLKYLVVPDGSTPPIIPKTTYTVYTDFQDGAPYSIFYARKTPTITMQYKNYSDDIDVPFQIINDTQSVPWRDIQFQTLWESENKVQVKYYQYTLFDADGEQIAQSEETYDTELYWYFRGFQTSDYETSPTKYTIQIRIVDELDKEFVVSQLFRVFYQTQQGIVPLQVALNCEEHAVDVIASSPVYVETTDADGKQTVNADDMDSNEDFLRIPAGEILNYTNVINPERTPIIIPSSFSFFTQFQITGEFLDAIPSGGEMMVFEIANDNTSDGHDVYYMTLGSFDSYYITPEGTLVRNEGQFKFRIYKNNDTTPLMCWNDGTEDFYNIQLGDEYQEFVTATNPKYALQESTKYEFVDNFPLRPTEGVKYFLTNDVLYQGRMYYQGAYEYDSARNQWKPVIDDEFFFVESLAQVPGFSYDDLEAPANTRTSDGSGLLYADEGNIWVDTGDYSDKINKDALNKKWFSLYLKVDNTSSSGEIVLAQVEINNERL